MHGRPANLSMAKIPMAFSQELNLRAPRHSWLHPHTIADNWRTYLIIDKKLQLASLDTMSTSATGGGKGGGEGFNQVAQATGV